MIYLDSAATTFQKPLSVSYAMQRAMRTMSSPGRGGYAAARAAEETAFRCRSLAAADYDYFHDFSSKFTRPAERSRHSRRACPGAAAYLVDTSAYIVAAYLKPPCYGARGLTVVSHIAQAVVGHPLRRADLR